ncbi:putative signal transducing protein [Parendozoicomonas haliclonae]|uniref:DUF2007 domain-containing protein n=1 Tax=Parendozoicomonas haliclonae TaxID=1960125 RepID=A0A1X7AQG8_9GAMM|nr:DUF2007 domain-containing protein [Parendozoicomonas haliclonae]SMA50554.1 hypothetical protein EHSB41UT_04365 [Parendozoicomonas haliclonae]
MIKVYSPQNTMEAECLHDMLTSHHIHSHIGGAFLQGATGELPAHDLIGLYTDIADADRAKELIDTWLKAEPVIEDE